MRQITSSLHQDQWGIHRPQREKEIREWITDETWRKNKKEADERQDRETEREWEKKKLHAPHIVVFAALTRTNKKARALSQLCIVNHTRLSVFLSQLLCLRVCEMLAFTSLIVVYAPTDNKHKQRARGSRVDSPTAHWCSPIFKWSQSLKCGFSHFRVECFVSHDAFLKAATQGF